MFRRLVQDEIVVGGALVILVFCALTVYSVVWLHTPFQPGDFGMGAASVLGAVGGGQGVRDWLGNKGGSRDPDHPLPDCNADR